MRKVIDIFNNLQILEKNFLNDKKYSYFCYRRCIDEEYKYIEGIYPILDNSILYQEITKKLNLKKMILMRAIIQLLVIVLKQEVYHWNIF